MALRGIWSLLFIAVCGVMPRAFAANATQNIDVSATYPSPCQGCTQPSYSAPTTAGYGQHYVMQPPSPSDYLVVLLSASGTKPSGYTKFLNEAGVGKTTAQSFSGGSYTVNYASIGLAYMDGTSSTTTVGTLCSNFTNEDECYTQMRGETVFGRNAVYPGWASGRRYNADAFNGSGSGATTNPPVSQADSVVNRLVLLLDDLCWHAKDSNNPNPSYWCRFLLDDTNSNSAKIDADNCYAGPSGSSSGGSSGAYGCYVSPHDNSSGSSGANYGKVDYRRKVVPDWSHIIIAGHSQGGGNAAFLAMYLPSGVPVHRALLFSSPEDNVPGSSSGSIQPASWITGATSTPLASFWGLRNSHEGSLGDRVDFNWSQLGKATGSSGIGGSAGSVESDVGNGSTTPISGSQIYHVDSPDDDALANHCGTAMNINHVAGVVSTWDWMLTGGGSSQ